MKKVILFSLVFISLQASPPMMLGSGNSVVPHDKDYYTHSLSSHDVQMIFTKDNMAFAQEAADIEKPLHIDYEKFFDWKLDETLYVGLISDYNQIANGFSTQWPNNRQINYVGGTQLVDYFTTTSWLDTLLYHESAHNYQANIKGSVVSRTLHSVIGNGSFIIPLPIVTPNIFENSFMLEGNAVLNESWHGNGGRLYSGRFKAETILQARAGNINSSYVYNSKLGFPYGEIVYIQGGFYNLYMAEKYGLEGINSYFKFHSEDWWWPFRTNWSMQDAVGKNFEKTLYDFANEQKNLAKNFTLAKGKHLLSSQFFSSLGNSNDEIFFITNETGVRTPELIVINKKTKELRKDRSSWKSGKVIKVDGEYYTQGSAHTSPLKIYQGLFSDWKFIKEGTESKMVQAYLSDGRDVYFDVPSSYSQPQLYVGDKFYDQVNSSVIVDKQDNMYYFKQDAKTRTLYKNRTPLFSYEGFYGLVSDVDSKGGVYFVANSELGTTLYKYEDTKVTRVSSADNVIEARLINDDELLVAAISEKDYYYVINKQESIDQLPYETKLFFEDEEYYGEYKKSNVEKLELNDDYYSVLDMHYSGTDFYIADDSESGVTGSLNINFGDPLSQNSANIFIQRDDANVTIAGVGYSNSQYLLEYSVTAYSVLDKGTREDVRDNGIIANASLPFLQVGYFYGALGASYFQDYDTASREPVSGSLTLYRSEYFGASMFSNCLNYLKIYAVKERGDIIAGGKYMFEHDLPSEFYIGIKAKHSKTDNNSWLGDRGVKMTNLMVDEDMDPSTISMPSLDSSFYAKSVSYGEVNLAKVINLSAYFFTFPFSLQREAVYAKYRYYNIKDFSSDIHQINEITVGFTLSTVFLNSLSLPISLEHIHTDSDLTVNKDKIRFVLGTTF